jgi:hypothetical protein
MAEQIALLDPRGVWCPKCGYDLAGSVLAAAADVAPRGHAPPTEPFDHVLHCPECGLETSLCQLRAINHPDLGGAPKSLCPTESVISGRLLVTILIVLAISLIVGLRYLL